MCSAGGGGGGVRVGDGELVSRAQRLKAMQAGNRESLEGNVFPLNNCFGACFCFFCAQEACVIHRG